MTIRTSRVRLGRLVLAAIALTLAACANNDLGVAAAPSTSQSQFWGLTLNSDAVTMSTAAPYDTFRLVATPRDAGGNPLAGLPAPVFTSSDLKHVPVDSLGLVHALGTATGVLVTASVTTATQSYTDTAYVSVTSAASPPALAKVSIHPDSTDSAETAVGVTRTLPTVALDTAGKPILGLAVYYRSLAPATATVTPAVGRVTGVSPGRVTLIATATAYGVTKADTLAYVVGWPIAVTMPIVPLAVVNGDTTLGFSAPTLYLSPGGYVVWDNGFTKPIDVTFADSTAVDSVAALCVPANATMPWLCHGSGNVFPFATDSVAGWNLQARSFRKPGTYTYHSTIFGTAGKVVVVDWRTL